MRDNVRRLTFFDVLRGFSVISMILFHLCYDLSEVFDIPLSWFESPLQDIWRASISWTFIFIAGFMSTYSRNNWRRGSKLLGVAALIWVITSIVAVDEPINYGIIFCIGSCSLIAAWVDEKLGIPNSTALGVVLFIFFVLTLPMAQGTLGVPPLAWKLPSWLYDYDVLSFLGFPGPTFVSGDYYPLLPYVFLFLCGVTASKITQKRSYPNWVYSVSCKPLEWFGKHALPIYLLHQPVLMGLLYLLLN